MNELEADKILKNFERRLERIHRISELRASLIDKYHQEMKDVVYKETAYRFGGLALLVGGLVAMNLPAIVTPYSSNTHSEILVGIGALAGTIGGLKIVSPETKSTSRKYLGAYEKLEKLEQHVF